VPDSPFAILTAVVAPAILTNACSVVALGTANRVARVVDHTKEANNALATLPADHADRNYYLHQLELLDARGQMLARALRFFYFALGAFAASALIAVLGSILTAWDLNLGFQGMATVGILVGSSAVGSLVYGCALMVREMRLAIDNMFEIAHLRVKPK
jgi:hypothetical protein